jgi:hypothetical protein
MSSILLWSWIGETIGVFSKEVEVIEMEKKDENGKSKETNYICRKVSQQVSNIIELWLAKQKESNSDEGKLIKV